VRVVGHDVSGFRLARVLLRSSSSLRAIGGAVFELALANPLLSK